MALIDEWLPEADVRSHHAVGVEAPPEITWHVLRTANFADHPLVQALMFLRFLPAFVIAPRATLARFRTPRRPSLSPGPGDGFAVLQERAPDEIVLGITGQFWTMRGTMLPTTAATFRDPLPTGMARAAWNFSLEPRDGGGTRLRTETRVRCADAETLRRFQRYWRLVSVGSGLIRQILLAGVKSAAEARHQP